MASCGCTVCLIMTTVMKMKKNRSKKPKLDHEPVRAMAKPPPKLYQDARRKAVELRCAKNVPPKDSSIPSPKKPEKCQAPAVNDVDLRPLVPYPVSPPTKEEVQTLEALLSCVPTSTDPVPLKPEPAPTQMDPPTQMEPPPSHTGQLPPPQEVICPFNPTSELQRRISAKGWDYIKCLEEKCPYWVPTAEEAVISELTPRRLDEEIAGGPWMCYCWEASCVRLVTKNPKSPNLGDPYLSCCEKPQCNWVDQP